MDSKVEKYEKPSVLGFLTKESVILKNVDVGGGDVPDPDPTVTSDIWDDDIPEE